MTKFFKQWTQSLFAQLTLAFLLLFILVDVAFFLLANWSNHRYYEEVTQGLNANLAMYIVQREPLIKNQQVNEPALKKLADLAMVVNPIVEVYLLDQHGNIIGHSLPAKDVLLKKVAIKPIDTLLKNSAHLPILGDDPRHPEQHKIFSVFPIQDQGIAQGYLYIVLGGQHYESLAEASRGSYIAQLSIASVFAMSCFALISAMIIFAILTRPLRKLAKEMNQFQQQTFLHNELAVDSAHEITFLQKSFARMRIRIQEQMIKLQENDQLRRELISNVSHDLRTPLASMQGYLEMLLLASTPREKFQHYAAIAFNHCQRITKLVKELFELSKLDAGRTEPIWEDFSLAELLQDVVQKFILVAERKSISLSINVGTQRFMVRADIALIERVLENLIDNALRYTPEGGRVFIDLERKQDAIEIKVHDTGIGLSSQDLPHIFERYYRAPKPQGLIDEQIDKGSGLGLAIVKRIVELHRSHIHVESQENIGSCFHFYLPVAGAHQQAA